jgi:hypothetical protein
MASLEKLPFLASLRVYWLNLIAVACAPIATVLASKSPLPASVPLVFFGLMIVGLLIPYRFGRAPYSFVLVGGLVYFFLGGAIAAVTIYAFGIEG